MNKAQYTLEQIQYRRNGVGGNGFHVIKFTDVENGPMLGIVFEGECRVAVFNRDLLKLDDIEFGSNSWRGDTYEAFLKKAIEDSRKS